MDRFSWVKVSFCRSVVLLSGVVFVFAFSALAQSVPPPKDVIGFTPGDDRKLASWAQVVDYFKKIDAASDRMIFEEIGKTTMGAPFVYATVSSPANLKKLDHYREINDKLADPRRIKGGNPTGREGASSRDVAAKKLIAEGKTIVLVTFGIHSTEVGSTLSSMLIAHRLTSSNEPEIKKILDNTIVLLVPSLNPDGVDIVKNWYDKTLGTPYEGTTPPELYHKYVGHDNNRDWYAFTQVETQLTVDKIHNVWHPQIVHDVHQQGANGARLFLPPYMDPVEPNVPKQIVEGYTELGNAMANDLRSKGFQGITTGTTYDAWTPARAYSHYHGGVRILSETASARLASPITVPFERLGGASGGLDAKKESDKFGPLWKGGEWKLSDITHYMSGAAFSLLNHAADNRERWLSRFYEIGKEAVRPRAKGELTAIILPRKNTYATEGDQSVREVLLRAGVEFDVTPGFTFQGRKFPERTVVVPMSQPYGAFAKALLESQTYPNLLDANGSPIAPYDVTAHTLPLLMDIEAVQAFEPVRYSRPKNILADTVSDVGCIAKRHEVQLYRSSVPSMDEGWTRWVLKNERSGRHPFVYQCDMFRYSSIDNKQIVNGEIAAKFYPGSSNTPQPGAIIFPDQSANQILNGYAKGSMPDEYAGGVGQEGVENLKKFVVDGGTLVFMNESTRFAIEQFKLPVIDVTRGLNRRDFYIPGSILRTNLDTSHPIAKGMPRESIAWFEDSPTFEIPRTWTTTGDDPGTPWQTIKPEDVRVIASYPTDPKQVLLSGWALGTEKIAGKAALVEIKVGKGKIVLFGFRPQYRAQSLATYPLLFNAISQ